MTDGVEVERRWLVTDPPAELRSVPAQHIQQGYLVIGDDGAEVRLRHRSGRHTLTVKSGVGLIRTEREIELSGEQFQALWPATEGARLQKRRYALPADGLTIELDVYEAQLAGLMIAEVEFSDPWAAQAFTVPAWFGRELTSDHAYRNQSLALKGRPAPGVV
ncbi:MAG: CYTH domain-containing protein [Solirubrobacteraceae bacterium]